VGGSSRDEVTFQGEQRRGGGLVGNSRDGDRAEAGLPVVGVRIAASLCRICPASQSPAGGDIGDPAGSGADKSRRLLYQFDPHKPAQHARAAMAATSGARDMTGKRAEAPLRPFAPLAKHQIPNHKSQTIVETLMPKSQTPSRAPLSRRG